MTGLITASAVLSLTVAGAPPAADPLPSWNDTPNEQAIVAFVERVTDGSSPDFVPADERIATFDNDGTLWCEQPMYVQLLFAIDRVRALAPEHPEWETTEPFRSILAGDVKGALAGGEKAVAAIVAATHAGMTTDEFSDTVSEWIATARHPETGRLFTDMVYQPQLELIDYLLDSGFRVYIVSGGGVEFMRPWTGPVYDIPPERVVGSRGKLEYEMRDGEPVLVKLPEIDLVDDKAGKPVGIQQQIGRRPILAFGNSDGDLQMLEWTTMRDGPSLGLILHHDDATREYAYDRDSHVGTLDRGLDEAPARGWILVSMKDDWSTVFPNAADTTATHNGEDR